MSGHKYPTTPQNIGQAMVRRIWKNVSTCVTQHMAENMTIYIYICLIIYKYILCPKICQDVSETMAAY